MPDEESLTPKDYALLDAMKREDIKFWIEAGHNRRIRNDTKIISSRFNRTIRP